MNQANRAAQHAAHIPSDPCDLVATAGTVAFSLLVRQGACAPDSRRLTRLRAIRQHLT